MFYMACQFTLLVFTSLAAWKLGWTYAPPSIKLHKFLTGNFQPSYQTRRLPTSSAGTPPRETNHTGGGHALAFKQPT